MQGQTGARNQTSSRPVVSAPPKKAGPTMVADPAGEELEEAKGLEAEADAYAHNNRV